MNTLPPSLSDLGVKIDGKAVLNTDIISGFANGSLSNKERTDMINQWMKLIAKKDDVVITKALEKEIYSVIKAFNTDKTFTCKELIGEDIFNHLSAIHGENSMNISSNSKIMLDEMGMNFETFYKSLQKDFHSTLNKVHNNSKFKFRLGMLSSRNDLYILNFTAFVNDIYEFLYPER